MDQRLVIQDDWRKLLTMFLDVTAINPAWLASLGQPSLCSFSKPVKNAAGVMMTIPRFGPDAWELPAVKAKSE